MIIKPLAHIRAVEAGVFGAKAANLGELWYYGIQTKPGFAIAQATESVYGQTGPQLLTLWNTMFRELVPLAVRSSAVGEDGEGASFAGQHDTILDVTEGDHFFDAFDQVLKSVALSNQYRADHGLGAVEMTVVVQQMVDAQSAGVLFTRNPVTGEEEIVIEATSGLGDKLVSGEVTPDEYVLKTGEGVIRRNIAGASQVLNKAQISALRSISTMAETLLRMGPLDLEWACDQDGRLWILQARPITTIIEPSQPALV